MNSKKIIPMIVLIVIALLVVATIVLAVIPKNYQPSNVEPTRIVLGENNRVYEKANDNDKVVYDNIMNYYKKSFNESSINSLFNGRLSYSPAVEYNDTVATISSFNSDYIMFVYDDIKTVKVENEEYSYNKIIIALSSTNVMKTVKAYLYNDNTFSAGTNYYVNTIGNLESLVNYVDSIK